MESGAVVKLQNWFVPGGHLKLLHLWPGQTPPPGRRRDEATLLG